MRKIYYTFEQLKKDLPKLKDTEISIGDDFDKTTRFLNTWEYKSVKAQLKRQNVRIKALRKEDIYGIR